MLLFTDDSSDSAAETSELLVITLASVSAELSCKLGLYNIHTVCLHMDFTQQKAEMDWNTEESE